MTTEELIAENEFRKRKFTDKYDPTTGEGSLLKREKHFIEEFGYLWIPEIMLGYPIVKIIILTGSLLEAAKARGILPTEENIAAFAKSFDDLRLNEDFEYWAIKCAHIQDKETQKIIPFRLRYAQRKLAKVLEEEHRWRKRPIRVNMNKARQWGGSTEIQLYIDWFQVRRQMNYNAIIVTDVEGQARNIRGMFTKMAENYPKEHGEIKLKPYEGSTGTRVIEGRGGIISVGSMQKPEASRSFDYQAAHLSEVASWKKTLGKEPKDLVQAVRSGILFRPETIIVQESTAKGTGNYWYNEWMASITGKSGYYPFFIAYWEIELYQEYIADIPKFIELMNNWDIEKRTHAWWQWSIGATFEAIKWYFNFKERENYDSWRMMAEFPADWKESFQSTGRRVMPPGDVHRMRKTWACDPIFQGECIADSDSGPDALKNIRLVEVNAGSLKIWAMPEAGTHKDRYQVTVDIGGTTDEADWSIISVFDRVQILDGGVPEAIATWEGHLPQDLVAWMGARIATLYDDALYAIESNSLVKKKDGDHFLTVLNEIKYDYDNLYCRTPLDKLLEGVPAQYGFHTNSQTKPMIVSTMRKALREDGYIEYDDSVLVEYDQFEQKDDGTYGAVEGAHDDKAMSRMIGYWICMFAMGPVTAIERSVSSGTGRKPIGESSF